MNVAAAKLRKMSMIAYTLMFGAIFADMMRRMSMQMPSEPLFYFLVLCVFAGSIMLVVKNRAISDIRKRIMLLFIEICFTLCLILISYGLPDFLGLVKYAIFIIVVAVYFGVYFSFLFKGRLQ